MLAFELATSHPQNNAMAVQTGGDIFHAFRCGKTDPARRQHLIILTAIEEMIAERKTQQQGQQGQQKATPSANEYFAAIMTALEAQDQSHTPEVCVYVCIFGMGLNWIGAVGGIGGPSPSRSIRSINSIDPTLLIAHFTL